MKIICISTVATPVLAEAMNKLNNDFALNAEFRIYYPNQINEDEIEEETVKNDLRTSDIVLIDMGGGGAKSSEVIYDALKDEKNIVLNLMGPMGKLMEITRLGSFSGGKIAARVKNADEVENPEELLKKMERVQNMVETAGKVLPVKSLRDARNYIKVTKYWRYGGKDNYYNLFLLLLREYFKYKLPKAKEPIDFPEKGIYHPAYGHFTDLEKFIAISGFNEDKPTIGMLFYGGMHFDPSITTIKAFINEFSDFNVIPVYSNGIHNLRAIREYFLHNGKPSVDVVINLMWFRINGGPLGGNPALTAELLKELNVPFFAPAPMLMRDVEKWKESPTGLSPLEIITAVVWPELDGCIEPIPSCGMQDIMVGEIESKELSPIDDRVKRIAGRLKNWVELKNKPNNEKKIAIVIYSFPPGEGNIGKAAYLDVFQSVKRLLEHLKGSRYTVELPEKELTDLFEEMEIVNSGTWFREEETLENCYSIDLKDYLEFFHSLPKDVQKDVIADWGEPPGTVMTADNKLLIPGIKLGNVFVGIQPARPPLGESDLAKAAHDKTKPPHHQYLAFYFWLQEIWGADAVIHVGTHGLAEFMKGKEVGMSANCSPDILIGNMPHLYIYHVLNTSESAIAKRRLYGTMIGYNSPPYTTSDLYEGYANLQDLIDEYHEAVLEDPLRSEKVKEKIFELAEELKFDGASIPNIHQQLYEMKRSIVPKGLHVVGQRYEKEDLKKFTEFILRYDREGIKSLNRIIAESMDIDYDSALRNKDKYASELDKIDKNCADLVNCCFEESIESAVKKSNADSKRRKGLKKTLAFGLEVAEKYADNSNELKSCLRGLNTEFIEPSLGGDVVRTPEVLPTGRNINQFDPNKIPTSTASERGAEIAENTIKRYLERDGKYPESVGIVLWGFETTKTGGETIGQILHYLGVKIIKEKGSWYPELEIIPLDELGRPRIDCLLNICGFFRDMFPNLIQLLNQAFTLVASLDEPTEMNLIRKHSLENIEMLKTELEKGVIDEKTANKIACGRIYGPKAGEYGTRMLPLVEDSIWEEEKDLAEVYIQSMNHLYVENIHAQKRDALYRKNLEKIDLVSQVRDSHDYEIVDLDHYYEFFGGLSKAVETVKGEKAAMLITDTTKEVIKTKDVGDVIVRGTRTRLLNPKWIDGMLEHDYHGAQQIADRLENTLGLAATTNVVPNWIWSSIAERFVFDEEMRKRLEENNKFAAVEIMERLFEAEKRGYWKATEEELEKMRQAYLEMEGDIEEGLKG
ncbi:MAG: magnesium chelatase subunit H [Euryarchaeota archaeon]|nr:magnesium chelatase subunit H [Euryarchaeota archaeon]